MGGTRMETDTARLLESYYAAWCSHDADRIIAVFTDDCVYEDIPHNAVSKGKEEFRKKFLDSTFAEIPDFKVELEFFFVAGDWICHEWIMTGTPKGEQPDSPATGESFSIRGASIAQIKNGKVASLTVVQQRTPC
jgi:steroid delta-isomerase-like uncharacterized protein